jgi:hypothetical protein
LLVPRGVWAQGPLGPEFRINTYTIHEQSHAAVASDSVGNFVVVWESDEQDGSNPGVFGQRYASTGAPLGPEFRVNTFTPDYQNDPSIASDSAGNFVVVWSSLDQDGSGLGVFGQRYASTGAPLGPEFRVNTFTLDYQAASSVASAATGNFVVLWTSVDQDGRGRGVFGQRYASSGAPLGPEFRVNTYTAHDQRYPSVASDAAGNFVVVWSSLAQDGPDRGVFGQRYANTGVPLGPEFRVNSHTTDGQFVERSSSVAVDAAGNFVVVWSSFNQDAGQSIGVFGQRYTSAGAPLGPEFRVNTFIFGHQRSPSVAADSSGNFVVAWASEAEDGSSYGVFGQRYDASGEPRGSQFRVNTYTTSQQLLPSVAADAAGSFLVVWDSVQDGSVLGVFGQRYRPIVPVELIHFGLE